MGLFIGKAVELSAAQQRARDSLARLPIETVPCLCRGRAFTSLASSDRYGIPLAVGMCEGCGLMQANPRMTADALRDFYTSDAYRQLYDGPDFVALYESRLTASHGAHILRALPGVRRVVEIGCGAGVNLVAFKEAGVEVAGWDYSTELIALGQRRGLNLRQGSIDQAIATGETFDAVILNHVLEHFTDPVAELKKLHALAPKLYVCVPDTSLPWLPLLQGAHLYYFTRRTLAHYLARAGWTGDVHAGRAFEIYTVASAGTADVALAGEHDQALADLRRGRWKIGAMEMGLAVQERLARLKRRLRGLA